MNEDAQLATRDKIIVAAAGLVARHGAARTSLDDVCAAAAITRAELHEHFADTTAVLAGVRAAGPGAVSESGMDRALRGLDSVEALRAWAEHYVEQLEHGDFRDEGVLGAIAGPWAAAGPAARADVGTMLGRWIGALADGLRGMRDRGVLCPEADADELASALLAMLLGGILLAKTRGDAAPLRSAVTVMMGRVQALTACDDRT